MFAMIKAFFKEQSRDVPIPPVKRYPNSDEANEWMRQKLDYYRYHLPESVSNLFDPSRGDYLPIAVHVGSSWKPEHQTFYRELKKEVPEAVAKAKKDFKTGGQYWQSRVGDPEDFDPDVRLLP